MGMRIHSVKQVQSYGSSISSELTDKILEVFKNADDGWVSKDETEGEIYRSELEQVIAETEDVELKSALQLLLDESDKNYEMVKFVLF